ncbi:GNAT family N-acetyltransferase [Stenotrophomonas sp. NPDC087984]|uniref:GNAT family N-acetyltransferase n=1 Tax=unclassified Streptomyces TaxID=2593676 RepID=UPI001ABCF390|nr:GNAT family N-acyltransferase [Streptomyces sp. NEAU-YJ-81]MBO3677940.1 GNAT family N-acetyltransferase [Streptomyces sp. NEAU-YJ-81]
MSVLTTSSTTAPTSSYVTSIAHTQEQIHAAQRLRYQVFGEERGGRLDAAVDGRDVDEFDEIMDHLIVTDTATGTVVGTYRLLPPGRSERLYSDTEFDLRGLPTEVRSSMVETGRACVHADHRTGAVINLMWAGLARYVLLSGHRYLAGCASVPLAEGEGAAANAWLLGTSKHAAPPEMRVHPLDPWIPSRPLDGEPSYADLPPLLRGYLRVGAWMCGSPQHDRAFNDADFFVLLDTERMNDRYRRYFLGESQ